MSNENIYTCFNVFLQKTVIEMESFFHRNSNNDIFKKKNLEKLVKRYVIDFIGSRKDDRKAEELFSSLKKNGEKKENESLSFEDKIKEQFKANNIFKRTDVVSDEVKKVFGHLMWLQYLPATKTKYDDKEYGKNKCVQIKELTGLEVSYCCDGIANYGMATMRLDEDLTDLVLLFSELVQDKRKTEDLEKVKNYIIKWCLDLKEDGTLPDDNNKGIRTCSYEEKANGRKCPTELLPIHNMLLHLCKPKHYASIAVSGHKKKIVETFEGLVSQEELPKEFEDNKDEYNKKLFGICKKLEDTDCKKLYSTYKYLWDVGQDKDYSEISALNFKKAVILYGPPGTSKTFSAKGLAQNLIYRLDYPKKITEFLNESKGIEKKQIHRLQLHPNYTYEDFIWGYQIENNSTIAKKGYFLNLLEKIKKDETHVHVLILDEINRIDLSRLFGELFSAIENRDTPVDLPVVVEGINQISIPQNLYIIGTMNDIDFSLERVDFALRRRFAWFFYGYDKDALADIIKENCFSNFNDEIQKDYIQCCSALNDAINNDTDLGSQYQIGHTFFAELVDIWKDMPQKEIKSVKTILWNISIGPMIEAYLGNCDKETKEKKIKNFRKTFGINEK